MAEKRTSNVKDPALRAAGESMADALGLKEPHKLTTRQLDMASDNMRDGVPEEDIAARIDEENRRKK